MNQCDGCARGLPIEDGIHVTKDDKRCVIGCTKHLYENNEIDEEKKMKLIEIDRCKHGMAIYREDDTGETRCFCGYCKPPSRETRKRLFQTKTTSTEMFMSDETLDRLKNGPYRMTFQVPSWAEDDFSDDYVDCTGEMPKWSKGISRVNAKTRYDKHWYSATVEFPYHVDNSFAREYNGRIKASTKDGWIKIHCIHLCGFLLAHGFRPGSHI